jgi:hypothetical protein
MFFRLTYSIITHILKIDEKFKCLLETIQTYFFKLPHHLYLYLCDPLKGLLLKCNYTISSTNQHMTHQHHSNITCHIILDSKKTLNYFISFI